MPPMPAAAWRALLALVLLGLLRPALGAEGHQAGEAAGVTEVVQVGRWGSQLSTDLPRPFQSS